MIPHRRREFQAGNQFTFHNPIHRASGELNSSDGIEYGTWAERIKGSYGYFGKSDDRKFGAWQRRTPPNLHGDQDDEEEFRWVAKEDDDDSDVASPPLWTKPGSPMTRSAESSPIHDHSRCHHHDVKDRFLYPTPQAQVIAGYRQEMLNMVRDMPETAYELSLRDLVEPPRMARAAHETLVRGRELPKDKTKKEKDRKEKTKKGMRRMSRSDSMDTGGFLLKMFLPSSLTTKRKSIGGSGTCAKVSPKPMLVEGEKGGLEKSTDRDWWRKNALEEKGSSSGSSSDSSSRSRKISGCYCFFRARRKTKPGKIEGDSVVKGNHTTIL
ncbi:uncharacterized protein LOC120113032 [Phoenix dactylifera]|uniref:Uncharacterized protein LOC120113032 n=1 Tax=Phoenix dactylifera TaxID=42345 RepID=A0A8B9B143_PHODC|nr:uncharacterized protein LOC120113032 [Phoenix dactylifera]